jgi:hypothetical protein
MWIRVLVKCDSCDKITNLRIQIPDIEALPISLKCYNCESEISAELTVDFENVTWDLKFNRGTLIHGDPFSGDFFYEYSDTLSTKKPSNEPHNIVVPTLRKKLSDLELNKYTKDLRRIHDDSVYQDFKDLSRAYAHFNRPIIIRLIGKIIGQFFPEEVFTYNNDLDYHKNYYLTLNVLMYPWIDFHDYTKFVDWLNNNIFNKSNITNPDLLGFINDVTTQEICDTIRNEICELTIRFIDLREYFQYVYSETEDEDDFVPIENFTHLKNIYTDCFEFIGRTSHLVFRLQNFYERGNQHAVPPGSPRNITSADIFASLDHGVKLDVLTLSAEEVPKSLYIRSFDNRLRNGINHYKARLDIKTQIISYFPIKSQPERTFQIKYLDFLNITLDSFNSVLKIGQLIKFVNVYKVATRTS